MFRSSFFSLGAGVAAVALGAAAGTTVAFAKTIESSDIDVHAVRGRVAGSIVTLQGLKTDYNGHVSAAVTALQGAQQALDKAVALRAPTQGVSDGVVRDVHDDVSRLLGRLSGDDTDYAGARGQAMTSLRSAQAELETALRTK